MKQRDFLGPYRLARLIRMGNSCQVWEAIDSNTNERFALKVLRADHRDNKEEIAFLKNEYAVAKALSHPNIIRMHDLMLQGDSPFLVLELFSELNIKQALRRGPESIAFMLEKIIVQCTESLYYMHSQGFVHCDIKPDNFLVSRDGDIKLIDFTISQKVKTGLARFFGGKAKNIAGTKSYMSPEQIRGRPLDQRSDVYSFGCVLYELVTGKPPYTGVSSNDLLNKHISAPIPSPLVLNDNVTNEFATIIKTAMAKRPEQRYESMWDLLKIVRGTKIFKKPPRIPEVSIFDDYVGGGRISKPDQAQSDPLRALEKPTEKPADKSPEKPAS